LARRAALDGLHDGFGETGELVGAVAGAGAGTHQDHRDLFGACFNRFF